MASALHVTTKDGKEIRVTSTPSGPALTVSDGVFQVSVEVEPDDAISIGNFLQSSSFGMGMIHVVEDDD